MLKDNGPSGRIFTCVDALRILPVCLLSDFG